MPARSAPGWRGGASCAGAALLVLASPVCAEAETPARIITDAQCKALVQADFSTVEDAPGTVLAAAVMPGSGTLPSYCEVTGVAYHQVQFRVRLPLKGWNGKLVVFGTGGQAGAFFPDDPASPVSWSGSALRHGFATAAHNGGHVSKETDGRWAVGDDGALLDYAFRAPHVAGVIARAVAARAYGEAARRVYYYGCSNGGREALNMAQRYPWDYDGIVAGAPSMHWSELFVHLLWFSNRLYGPNAVLDAGALATLHRYVLSRCDALDGRRDGILDDPRRCEVDLAPITCADARTDDCLTPAQAMAARQVYDGPRDAAGRQLTFSSAMPGSELVWDDFRGIEGYPLSVLRYQSFTPPPGASFRPDEADIGSYLHRSGGSDAMLGATNPDLRRFRDHGGKLLSYMGWNDPLGGVRETIDYHQTVGRTMGGRAATDAFYRLFMVPGMNHRTGGDGAYQADWLAALDAWVEHGTAPDAIAAYHPDARGRLAFTRTLRPLDLAAR